jgi:hypothetical protein
MQRVTGLPRPGDRVPGAWRENLGGAGAPAGISESARRVEGETTRADGAMNRAVFPAPSEPRASEAPQREAARPAPPGVTRDEIDLLIRRAGLTLNAGQKADLAVAFQHLVTLAARLPRARPFTDEPAFVFHPAIPGPQPEADPRAAKPAAAKPAGAKPAAAKPAGAKPALKAKPKPKAKRASGAAPKPKAKARPAAARTAQRSARPARRR